MVLPGSDHGEGLGGLQVGGGAGGSGGSAGVEETSVYPSSSPVVHHHGLPLVGLAGGLGPADGVEPLHAGVVGLEGLADVLGVGLGHAVHVEVTEAGGEQDQHLERRRGGEKILQYWT